MNQALLKSVCVSCGMVFGLLASVLSAEENSVGIDKRNVLFSVRYEYAKDGTLLSRTVNGAKQIFEYDLRGQVLAVKDVNGNDLERYVYDPVGNILSKTIAGSTTRFTYDDANQLVTRTDPDGKVTTYEYDAAGRLVREGGKTYTYGYLDKILSVQENGKTIADFDYYVDGQVASVTRNGVTESFVWDGLALIGRGTENYINEPHIGGGTPIASNGKVMFNDMLGSTVGIKDGANLNPVSMTSFGVTDNQEAFFTGKPYIGELGYAFLFRNYRADNGKWQTSDPLGYPDGWNQFAYCNNGVINAIDWLGCAEKWVTSYNLNSSSISSDQIVKYAIYKNKNVEVLNLLQNYSVTLIMTAGDGTFSIRTQAAGSTLLQSPLNSLSIVSNSSSGELSLSSQKMTFAKQSGSKMLAYLAYSDIVVNFSLIQNTTTSGVKIYDLRYELSSTGGWSWRQAITNNNDALIHKAITWSSFSGSLGSITVTKE